MPEKPFMLSIKMLIRDDHGRWLLLQRSKDSSWNPGKWDLPGGKIKAGETFEEALLREVYEETGLSTEVGGVFRAIDDETPDYRLVHLIMNGGIIAGDVKLSAEHQKYIWVTPGNIGEIQLCSYLQCIMDADNNQA